MKENHQTNPNESIILCRIAHHRPSSPITAHQSHLHLSTQFLVVRIFSSLSPWVEFIYQFSKPLIKIPTFPRRKRSLAQSIELISTYTSVIRYHTILIIWIFLVFSASSCASECVQKDVSFRIQSETVFPHSITERICLVFKANAAPHFWRATEAVLANIDEHLRRPTTAMIFFKLDQQEQSNLIFEADQPQRHKLCGPWQHDEWSL